MNRPPSHSTLRGVLLAKAAIGIALTACVVGVWWLGDRGVGVEGGSALDALRAGDAPRFDWRSIDGKHWQALTPTDGEPASVTDVREANSAGCPGGMVRVKGAYKLDSHGADATGEIGALQNAACTDWISREFPARCRTFDAKKIAASVAKLPTRDLDFCMDRFEYPNRMGENPIVVVTFHEAEALCAKSNKRLCTESEWTFACEGEDAQPYPYGYSRDETACVIDREWRPFHAGALSPRDGDGAREELDRLWQGEPSGSRGGCKSPFGVYDMTGNVDEWTHTARSTGYVSILKGGYWGPVRARCRPATRAHNEDFVAYQQGFRCCADASEEVPAPAVPEPPDTEVHDAGPVTLADYHADAGPSEISSSEGDEGQDELEALARAHRKVSRLTKLGLSCAAGPRGGGGAGVVGVALVGLAVAGAARRRRARS